MGVDHTVALVFGIRIAGSKLLESYEEPSCKHVQLIPAKYCAECGSLVKMYTRTRWKPEFAEMQNEDEIEGYELMLRSYYEEDVFYYLGEITKFDPHDNDRQVELTDMADLKADMQKKLEPLGLWDESTFGVWLVNRYS